MKRLVLIESPLASATPEGFARNQLYAKAAMRDSLFRGEAPFASHLLYAQEHILDDSIFFEREMGIEAGLRWGSKAELTAVYLDLDVSSGMKRGIDRALQEGRPVEYRRLGSDWESIFKKTTP